MSYKLGNEAEICETHSKYHLYCPDGMSNYGVAFNDAWKLINLFKDGRWFHAARLSADEEEYGEEIMRKAFTHWKDVMVFSGGRARAVEDMQSFMSETSNGSDLFPKSFLIEEVIGKVVRKQLELVESCIVKRFREELELVESRIVKQIREELELGKPNLADLVEGY
ncbi:hypothetical protein EUGRSUZ_L02420 [Eucalyptus grandis]|uniref:Calmodulin binding protein C-terminal domain-containing protein n=1 Tax=Eucalyptus grandis TaxID=71139 RepID=A0A058ZS25_EUCGR|nr:hypothetical protein EUGRSUZ_L02420 [Eucalyptus grandis]